MKSLIVYLHGFLGSPQSHKAMLTAAHLRDHHADIALRTPLLPEAPMAALQAARAAVVAAQAQGFDRIGLIGSSMGGFYATVLAEQFGLRAVLINPSVRPEQRIDRYFGEQLNPWSGRTFHLGPADAAALAAMAPPALTPARYWLLLQTGDEVLDHREAVAFYHGCRQTLEPGGDHAFQGFERHLPGVVEFLQCRSI